MKRTLLSVATIILATIATANAQRLEIVAGQRAETSSAKHYLRGMTDPDARIEVNGRTFKVYPTGAFAAEVQLTEGDNKVTVKAVRPDGSTREESFDIRYTLPQKPQPVEGFAIERFTTVPARIEAVSVGDQIILQAKATPGCRMTCAGDVEMKELPAEEAGCAGIYQGRITVRENDPRLAAPLKAELSDGTNTATAELKNAIEIMDSEHPVILRTTGELPYLNYGLGTDRLGGSKMSRITDGILLEAVGKTGGMYKVRLSKNRTAYIPEDCVEQAPEGMLPHQSLVEAWSVRGNDKGDVVTISLSERLPFATFQMTDPSRICVDIFGAVANTSWITQIPDTWNVISHVDYEQIEEDIFRVILTLRNDQHWGHSVSYNGTSMVIRVKKQPELTLRGMHIALDAGHGGESCGAVGTTGCNEKDINLAIVKELKSALESRGAKITLTRDGDYDVSMNDRLLLLRKADPDLLISIHCNAGGSPFTGKGTSTYYRHIGFRPLSTSILSRVLTLGVNNFGNIGSFNFALSSPTEYPNVLVETLFMSSPEDEARLMDPEFRTDLVKQIVKGLEDFLRETKKNSK